jgi:hypothetical protein
MRGQFVRICALAFAMTAILAAIHPSAAGRQAAAPVLSDADLIAESDVIVTGRVARIAMDTDDRTIYTYVTVDVASVLKGWVPERQIVIKQPGGRVGDVEHVVPGRATFERDEALLVFLQRRGGDPALTTTALWQGKWTIVRDGVAGEAIARRPLIGAADRGVFGPAADARHVAARRKNGRRDDIRGHAGHRIVLDECRLVDNSDSGAADQFDDFPGR